MKKNDHKSTDPISINTLSRLEVILDGIQDIIYVADPDTYELLFVNNAFSDQWGEQPEGKTCYQVLQGREDPCPFCTNHLIFGEHLGETHIWEFQNQVNGRHYRCADRAVRWTDERWVRFEIAADITTRVQAEQALKDSEQRYRNFLGNFHGIAFQSHLDYTPILFEGDVKRITGYSAQDFMAGKPRWDEIIHPADREWLYRDYPPDTFQEPGHRVEREYRILDQSGAVRWVRDAVQSLQEGDELILQGSILEISRQKQAELELLESEARYRALAEASPEMIFMIDRQDRVIYLNPAAAEMFRVNPEDIIGTPRLELFPPQVAENQSRGLEYVFSTGEKIHAESQVPFPGREMWLSTWLVPIKEGGQIQAVLGISQDITSQHQAQNNLNQHKKLLDLIINSIPMLVSYLDQNYQYQFVNQAYQALFNLPPEEIVGKHARDVIGEEAFDSVKADLDQALEGRPVHYLKEMSYSTGTRWTETDFVPDKTQDGDVRGLVALVSDVTGQKETQSELEDKVSELERFNRMAVGRELRMLELKREVNQLLEKQGEKPRYILPQQSLDMHGEE